VVTHNQIVYKIQIVPAFVVLKMCALVAMCVVVVAGSVTKIQSVPASVVGMDGVLITVYAKVVKYLWVHVAFLYLVRVVLEKLVNNCCLLIVLVLVVSSRVLEFLVPPMCVTMVVAFAKRIAM